MDIGSSLKAILFDFDGTILSLPIDWAALKSELKLGEQKLGDFIQEKINEGDYQTLEIITRRELEAVENSKVDEQNLETLKELASKYKLAILTRNSRKAVALFLKNNDLDNLEIEIVGREDVKNQKPDPASIKKALDTFGLDSNQALVVGDTFHDVESAKQAGVLSALVYNPKVKDVKSEPDYLIDHLSELMSLTKGGENDN